MWIPAPVAPTRCCLMMAGVACGSTILVCSHLGDGALARYSLARRLQPAARLGCMLRLVARTPAASLGLSSRLLAAPRRPFLRCWYRYSATDKAVQVPASHASRTHPGTGGYIDWASRTSRHPAGRDLTGGLPDYRDPGRHISLGTSG